MTRPDKTPVVWTVAGSDSGGGAGIQADLKTMNAFGVHGCSVITALTAQNTQGVQSLEPVSESMLRAQLDALKDDLPPAAVKTGMLGSSNACKIVAEFFQSLESFIVCDPVLASTSGENLLEPEALDILIGGIFPTVGILTPNLPEVGKIIGEDFQTSCHAVALRRRMENAAARILELGVGSVLIKGGHAPGGECRDYWTNGKDAMWLSSPRIETAATHGTGCILSAAIAAAVALGQDIPNAVITAKTFLNQCLKNPAHLGGGPGPMMMEPFRNDPAHRPTIH
ncbi:MAG: bifunctional hydroxymethylpyrimidine kinase/phosphomethylpyrimidine kinase [Kiritimatiellales bacterium]|nr:bifunctional hydroxymethylpyrimidine kinase/phosphomethylpyrimidine kinase [Kiritimatiellales bacterium]